MKTFGAMLAGLLIGIMVLASIFAIKKIREKKPARETKITFVSPMKAHKEMSIPSPKTVKEPIFTMKIKELYILKEYTVIKDENFAIVLINDGHWTTEEMAGVTIKKTLVVKDFLKEKGIIEDTDVMIVLTPDSDLVQENAWRIGSPGMKHTSISTLQSGDSFEIFD